MKKLLNLLILLSLLLCTLTSCTQADRLMGSDDTLTSKHNKSRQLDVPIINQNPELKNGCEVTSLAMLLQYAGINVDKMILADELAKDPAPPIHDAARELKNWGDPDIGFVGDITGQEIGFGVYEGPLLALLEAYLPGQGIDLSQQPFDKLLDCIDQGQPVIVWITIDFNPPDKYVTWQCGTKTITTTFDEHAVLLVGYDEADCLINNPYTGERFQRVPKDTFKRIWSLMGSRAISYRPRF